MRDYNKDHCWQYDIRLRNLEKDLLNAGITEEYAEGLTVSDFDMRFESKEDVWDEAKEFIERHEWLGKMGLYPTHIFTARHRGILAGVLSFDMPNAFSKLLGDDTRKMERLIGRGACISWSPKNLASSMISSAIKEMVKTTPYRLFVAYSDPEANELGTIYQACNFYYLGQTSGAKDKYKVSENRWVSSRYFRSRSVYKRLAKEDGIVWDPNWQDGDKIHFDRMPRDIEKRIKTLSKEYQNSCEKKEVVQKHKYAYILGRSKKETKELRSLFEKRNKTYKYPKNRGK